MAAERTFWHGGLRVDVWAKSFKWSGMPFLCYTGEPPDDDKIRKMIDTAQRPLTRNFRCPICEAGKLVPVAPEVWHCERRSCNTEVYYEGPPGMRTVNVRDKPRQWRGWFGRHFG